MCTMDASIANWCFFSIRQSKPKSKNLLEVTKEKTIKLAKQNSKFSNTRQINGTLSVLMVCNASFQDVGQHATSLFQGVE